MLSTILFVMRIDAIRTTPSLVVACSSISVRSCCLFAVRRMLIACKYPLRLRGIVKSRGASSVTIVANVREAFFRNEWWKPWPGVAVLHPMSLALVAVCHRQYGAINLSFRLSKPGRCHAQKRGQAHGSDK